jgi:phytoene desaturase
MMWEASRSAFVESELSSLWPLLKRKDLLRQVKQIAPFTTLRKLSNRLDLDPHLRMIVDRYATYTGSDPRRAPAVLLTIAFVESTFGAWHIKGGIGQLSVALEQRCRDLGVDFKFNTLITKIITSGETVTGLQTQNGEIINSNLIVANADAEYVFNQLLNKNVSSAKSERRKLKVATKSLAGFSVLLGLNNSKMKPITIAHHNVYFPKDYDAEFDQIFTKKVPVTDPTIYICAPKDSSMVKSSNQEAWFVLVNAPRHDLASGWDWRSGGDKYAASIINKLDGLGLSVSNRVEIMQFRTPYDLENYAMAPGGSIYGTSSNSVASAFLRARNRSKVKGLFCVSGSAHPGGGLPLVGISAEIVANAIGKA